MNTLSLGEVSLALAEFIKDCLGVEACQRYERILPTLGEPAYDCSLIAVYLDRGFNDENPQLPTCHAEFEYDFIIKVVQCCLPKIESNATTDELILPTPEEITKATICVLDDMQKIINCLLCSNDYLAELLGLDSCDGIYPKDVTTDPSEEGFCYGGNIRVRVHQEICCPDPVGP